MTGPFGVHSEVGQPRQAVVHRPRLELSRLTPGNCHDLLFDDALWADRARQEHDVFAQTLRDHGVLVHYFDELLTRTLQSDEARAFVLGRLCTPELVGPTLAGPLHRLVPSPLPDTLFQRDNSAWIFGGVSVNPIAKAARVRESLNTRAVHRFHPMFAGATFPALYGDDFFAVAPGAVLGYDGSTCSTSPRTGWTTIKAVVVAVMEP